MVKRIGSSRRKTRHQLRKPVRQRGKLSLRRYFQSFNVGDRVCLVAEPSVHKGTFHQRFHGKTGTIKGTEGECYSVLIKDANKEKTLIVHPIHLRKR